MSASENTLFIWALKYVSSCAGGGRSLFRDALHPSHYVPLRVGSAQRAFEHRWDARKGRKKGRPPWGDYII